MEHLDPPDPLIWDERRLWFEERQHQHGLAGTRGQPSEQATASPRRQVVASKEVGRMTSRQVLIAISDLRNITCVAVIGYGLVRLVDIGVWVLSLRSWRLRDGRRI